MKKNTLFVLTFSIIIAFSTSCIESKKKKFQFNGIYQTAEIGKTFKFHNDSNKTIIIDTIPIISEIDFKKLRIGYHSVTEKQILFIDLTESGKEKFLAGAKRNIRKPLAVILNDKLLSAPMIHTEFKYAPAIELNGLDENQIAELMNYFN
ncbi:MAG: hypothetical protein N4A74_01330 [Carboxylicivirga sp.]|jgi:preprotein translocase subunit SecD|nr:hypothetical protein [Carboxylicivirga sp.]